MTAVIKRLSRRIFTSSGKLKKGALSRASERLGVSRTTIRRWIAGEWQPGRSTSDEISRILRDGSLEWGAKKPGPKDYFSEGNGDFRK